MEWDTWYPSFTHLAQGDAIWTRPSEAPLRQQSAYGNDRFLHGRPYLADLGLSDHRARFYDLDAQTFLSPDPLGPIDSPSVHQAFRLDPTSVTDPSGRYQTDFHYYVTYLLAYLAMGDVNQAHRAAWASQHVDDHPWTDPYSLEPRVLVFHFLDVTGYAGTPMGPRNQAASTVLEEAINSGEEARLAVALHTYADTFSHAGFTWKSGAPVNYQGSSRHAPGVTATGHALLGDKPDRPYLQPRRAALAGLAVFRSLMNFAQSKGLTSHPKGLPGVVGSDVVDESVLLAWLESAFRDIVGDEDDRVAQWRDVLRGLSIPLRDYSESEPAMSKLEFESALEHQLWEIDRLMPDLDFAAFRPTPLLSGSSAGSQ